MIAWGRMLSPRTRYCSRCLTTFLTDVDGCPNLSCRSVRPHGGWGELLEAGDIIDRNYRILDRLAIGGAGVTYLGRELDEQEREVGPRLAIKLLYQQRDQGPYLRRLATEAQIIQGLNHPNIVEYQGFVHRAGHSPYLVTRYEAGGSLLDHIHRVGVLNVPVAAAVGVQVCGALAMAHAQGVIHRDLKPENVLLERRVAPEVVPSLRLADFGIAKVFGGVGERLTRVGAFVGTPQFASPEQFEGLPPEPATDVYAAGAMLFYCLMGRPVAGYMDALEPDQQLTHLLAHLPPRLERPDLPAAQVAEMERILGRAMAPQAHDRCPMEEFARLLTALSAGPPIPDASGREAHDAAVPPPLPPPGKRTINPDASSNKPVIEKPVGNKPVNPKPARSEPPEPPPARRTVSGDRSAEDKPAGSSRLGCGLVFFGLSGLLALGLLGAAAVWWAGQGGGGEVIVLSSKDADPERVAEWNLVAGAINQSGRNAARQCRAPLFINLDVTVDKAGMVTDLALPNYDHTPTRLCMLEQLQKQPVPRKLDKTVRVVISLVAK